MEAFVPFPSPTIAHFMLFALPFPPYLAAEFCAVRGDIPFEGKFVPDMHVQFAQANLLSISVSRSNQAVIISQSYFDESIKPLFLLDFIVSAVDRGELFVGELDEFFRHAA